MYKESGCLTFRYLSEYWNRNFCGCLYVYWIGSCDGRFYSATIWAIRSHHIGVLLSIVLEDWMDQSSQGRKCTLPWLTVESERGDGQVSLTLLTSSFQQICTVIFTSYEVEQARMTSPNAIEVVHNNNPNGDEDIEDLVFNQTTEGYQVDETSLHEKTNADLQSEHSKESAEKTEDLTMEDDEEEDVVKVEHGEFT